LLGLLGLLGLLLPSLLGNLSILLDKRVGDFRDSLLDSGIFRRVLGLGFEVVPQLPQALGVPPLVFWGKPSDLLNCFWAEQLYSLLPSLGGSGLRCPLARLPGTRSGVHDFGRAGQ
jgi:hypothetical protein